MLKSITSNDNYPVVFFVFRRPDTTEEVLKEIIKSKPSKLYVFADGPRNKEDELWVNKTREMIDNLLKKENIIVIKKYRKENYGLKKSIIEGLDEAFLHEEAVIILEDDCLPSARFFDFCNIALNKFKDDQKVNTVCGTNIDPGNGKKEKCIASRYFLPWGWGLWKRSWLEYKKIGEDELGSILRKKGANKILAWYLLQVYGLSKIGKVGAWSYRLIITQIVRDKFSVYPLYNTVSNIGFGGKSSNTWVKTTGSYLKINPVSKETIVNFKSHEYRKDHDKKIMNKLYVTPISVSGLILRKYFSGVIKYLYR